MSFEWGWNYGPSGGLIVMNSYSKRCPLPKNWPCSVKTAVLVVSKYRIACEPCRETSCSMAVLCISSSEIKLRSPTAKEGHVRPVGS